MVVSPTAIPELQSKVTRELLKDGGAPFNAVAKEVSFGSSHEYS